MTRQDHLREVDGRWRRASLATVVTVVALFAGQFLWLMLGPPADHTWLWRSVGLVVPFGVSLILLALWLRLREKRGLSSLGVPVRRPVPAVLGAGALALVLLVISSVVGSVVGGTGDVAADTGGDPVSQGVLAVAVILVATALQSSTEELLFRGYLLGAVRTGFGSGVAVAFSSLVFGLCHSFNADISVVYVTSTVALGALLGIISLGRGGLWAACGFHTVWNLVQNLVADPSAGSDTTGSSSAGIAALLLLVCCVGIAAWFRVRHPGPDLPTTA
ncbi:CPBP family intramembrane metalloprotease [Pseudonocardia sp. TMWB2A]|uniref:CPBP family intramembrane glutamic endopeptidase n=1 Tax=Pseudonocardia sp. TMWB2A TaxID=687430 RepID=UPI00307F1164